MRIAEEVGRYNSVFGVCEKAFEFAFGSSFYCSADLIRFCGFFKVNGKVNNRNVDGGNAECHTGKFAVKSRDNFANSFCCAGGGRNNVAAGCTAAAPVFFGRAVNGFLGCGYCVNGGHKAVFDAEVIVDNFCKGCKAVGGAAGVIHAVDTAVTDCQPNDNVEALRIFMLDKKVECRPLWKPMHKQPVYSGAAVYTNCVEEDLFKVGFCLPAGPYVTDDDVRYIVECIKEAIA